MAAVLGVWAARNAFWLVALAAVCAALGVQTLKASRAAAGERSAVEARAAAERERDEARARVGQLDAALRTAQERREAELAERKRQEARADEAEQRNRETAAAAGAAGLARDRAEQRVRDLLARAAAGGAGGGAGAALPASPGGCAATDEAARVLADVLGRCGARVRELAAFADASHNAAVTAWEAWPEPAP